MKSISLFTIIVTYNGEQWIRKCVKSLFESDFKSTVIVADNASDDNTVNIIANEFPTVELIKNTENRGFGAANNIAIQIALERNADYIFLLNQDVYIEQDSLSKMIKLFESHREYGIISPVQFNGDGKLIDLRFKNYLKRVLNKTELDLVEKRKWLSTDIVSVRFVNAAAWLLDANAIKKTGLFHPLFFHYGEDNNLSSRMQYHGYKVGIALNVYVCHDRPQYPNKEKELLQKIGTIIRYSATDPRKNFFAAYLEALYKYFNLLRKTSKKPDVYKNALEEEKKFIYNIRLLKKYRQQMKKQGIE